MGGGVFHGAEGGGNPAAVCGLGTADGGNHTRIDCPCAEKGADGSAELFDGLSAQNIRCNQKEKNIRVMIFYGVPPQTPAGE